MTETSTRHVPGRRLKQHALRLGVVIILLACIDATYLLSAGTLFTLRDKVTRADIIVVLGGDGLPRAERAAKLWHAGVAPHVLVSGAGDCWMIKDAMVKQGVDGHAISVECHSHSTWQNAAFSAPILAAMNVKQAILVTSWFHSRRAIACFSQTSDDIRWYSIPAKVRPISWMLFFNPEGIAVLEEGLKTLWYRWDALCRPSYPQTALAARRQIRSS